MDILGGKARRAAQRPVDIDCGGRTRRRPLADVSGWGQGRVGVLALVGSVARRCRYETDAYPVYEWLPRDRHIVGKGGAVNRNEGLHSKLRSKLNTCEEYKGISQEHGDTETSAGR